MAAKVAIPAVEPIGRVARPSAPDAAPGIGIATQAGARPADEIIHTDHAEIAIRQSSGGKLPLLLIHGNSQTKDVFERQFESFLGQEFRMIGMDLPGHGASSDAFDPRRTYSIRGYADAAIQVLEALGIDQVAVFGWSLGGHIGLELIEMYPDIVGVMLSGTPPVSPTVESMQAGFRPHPALALGGRETLDDEEVEMFAHAACAGSDDPSLRAAVRRTDGRARRYLQESIVAGQVSDQRRVAETSPVPIAIVQGVEDPFVCSEYVASVRYANLWERRCHILSKVGHAPFLEAPELFNQLLARFMQQMDSLARARADDPDVCYSA